MTLRLREHARSDQYFGTRASAKPFGLRELARSNQCFGTPPSATTLLFSELINASVHLLVL